LAAFVSEAMLLSKCSISYNFNHELELEFLNLMSNESMNHLFVMFLFSFIQNLIFLFKKLRVVFFTACW
jgi:hypothetical protein